MIIIFKQNRNTIQNFKNHWKHKIRTYSLTRQDTWRLFRDMRCKYKLNIILDKRISGTDCREGYLYPRYGTIALETINIIRS